MRPDRKTEVVREQADSYYINAWRDGYHRGWARIFVQSGQRPRREGDGGPTWWCYVAVISDWGNFGHLWSHCGREPVEFLSGLEFDYAMQKLMWDDFKVFRADAYLGELRQHVLQCRRDGAITREEARKTWEAIEEAEDVGGGSRDLISQHLYGLDHDERPGLDTDSIVEFDGMVPNPQAVGFWRDCWPHFIAALKEKEALV